MEHTQRFTDLVLLHRANAVEEFSGIDERGRAAQVIVLAETADAAGRGRFHDELGERLRAEASKVVCDLTADRPWFALVDTSSEPDTRAAAPDPEARAAGPDRIAIAASVARALARPGQHTEPRRSRPRSSGPRRPDVRAGRRRRRWRRLLVVLVIAAISAYVLISCVIVPNQAVERIETRGVRCVATVESVQSTPSSYNNRTLIEFVLRVALPDAPPAEGRYSAYVSSIDAGRLGVGSRVPCRALRDNLEYVLGYPQATVDDADLRAADSMLFTRH